MAKYLFQKTTVAALAMCCVVVQVPARAQNAGLRLNTAIELAQARSPAVAGALAGVRVADASVPVAQTRPNQSVGIEAENVLGSTPQSNCHQVYGGPGAGSSKIWSVPVPGCRPSCTVLCHDCVATVLSNPLLVGDGHHVYWRAAGLNRRYRRPLDSGNTVLDFERIGGAGNFIGRYVLSKTCRPTGEVR
jgi:hypothetical protein